MNKEELAKKIYALLLECNMADSGAPVGEGGNHLPSEYAYHGSVYGYLRNALVEMGVDVEDEDWGLSCITLSWHEENQGGTE